MRKLELELISDADINLLFEKGVRGRISYIFKRYLKSTTQNKNQNIFYTETLIIYMTMWCPNIFQQVHSNGKILKMSIQTNTEAIVEKVVL